MSDILEQSADLSLIATSMNLPVPSGCEVYSFMGGSSLTHAVKNWANLAKPLVAFGAPPVGVSGATVDTTNYFGLDTTIPTDTSETYIVVGNTPVNPPTQNHTLYSSAVSNYNTGVSIMLGANGLGGPTAIVGFNNSGVNGQVSAGIGANNSPTFTAESLPCIYVLTIDMTAMNVIFSCVSPTNWTGVTPITRTVAIPTGYTRLAAPTRGFIGKTVSGTTTATGAVHFFGKWSRVLSSTELDTVVTNVKSLLSKRGISVG